MEYIKDFDSWNIRKQSLNNTLFNPPYFKEKEIWWLSIGINIGYEEDGKHRNFSRPILIIKKFNKNIFLGVPLSTKLKVNPYYIKISIQSRIVSAMISQLRVFSSKRMLNKMGEVDKKDFCVVVRSVKDLLSLPK